jgi:RimJ/RimL family protein N-acetyltransferase
MDELLEYVHQKNSLEDALLFGIFLSTGGGLIGTIKLEPIDRNTCEAWLGVMIGNTDFRHLGYGTEAIKGILRYSKEVLSLKKITLGVDLANTVAIDTYLKIGFSTEMRKKARLQCQFTSRESESTLRTETSQLRNFFSLLEIA